MHTARSPWGCRQAPHRRGRHRDEWDELQTWRAVDSNSDAPDILVRPRLNAKAGKRFLKRLVTRTSAC
jgi:transposase-like protein